MTMINDIKKLLRSKKGAAIEMALFLMAIIFLFSTLITVFCLSIHSNFTRRVDKMNEAALIDSFGEAFVNSVNSNNKSSFTIDNSNGYNWEVSEDGSRLTIKDKSGRVRLVVTVDGSGKVKSWLSFVETGETSETTVSGTQE